MILLQILDEGSITDSQGRKVDFKVCAIPNCEVNVALTVTNVEHDHLLDEQPRQRHSGTFIIHDKRRCSDARSS